jgi:ORF6N domain
MTVPLGKDPEAVAPKIYTIRDEPVVLDSDLALLYGVETKNFNKAVRRNAKRFPSDFAFQLKAQELADLKFQIGTSSLHGGRRNRPWVFTEHSAIMAATILNSERAVAMSVGACPEHSEWIVRAFVRMRRELLTDATLERRLATIEKTLIGHDTALRELYQKIRPLLLPPPDKAKPQIGFHRKEEK